MHNLRAWDYRYKLSREFVLCYKRWLMRVNDVYYSPLMHSRLHLCTGNGAPAAARKRRFSLETSDIGEMSRWKYRTVCRRDLVSWLLKTFAMFSARAVVLTVLLQIRYTPNAHNIDFWNTFCFLYWFHCLGLYIAIKKELLDFCDNFVNYWLLCNKENLLGYFVSQSLVGPTLWKSLPDSLRDPAVQSERFRRDLKTHLFAGL